MTDEMSAPAADYIALASEIVAAYVSNNVVRPVDLPALIASVHAAVTGMAGGGAAAEPAEVAVEKASPAQVRRSISTDGLVSFLDGKTYRTLKRHLTANGLTPERYRERYGLPTDYPMVCQSYSERRSNLAKSIGLGTGGRAARAAKAPKQGKTA